MIINSQTTLSADEFKKIQKEMFMTDEELLADLSYQESELVRFKKLLSKAKLERNEMIYENCVKNCEARIKEIKNKI